jgi:hypothetical protein
MATEYPSMGCLSYRRMLDIKFLPWWNKHFKTAYSAELTLVQ